MIKEFNYKVIQLDSKPIKPNVSISYKDTTLIDDIIKPSTNYSNDISKYFESRINTFEVQPSNKRGYDIKGTYTKQDYDKDNYKIVDKSISYSKNIVPNYPDNELEIKSNLNEGIISILSYKKDNNIDKWNKKVNKENTKYYYLTDIIEDKRTILYFPSDFIKSFKLLDVSGDILYNPYNQTNFYDYYELPGWKKCKDDDEEYFD